MISDIQFFDKNKNVIDVKEFLDCKYKVDLSYQAVYREFRKIFPFFGPDDANYFLNWCKENSYTIKTEVDYIQKQYTKVLICSTYMQAMYKLYGEILIIDSTYRVNHYKLPLTIISGFTHKGKNCICVVEIHNDETQLTFK